MSLHGNARAAEPLAPIRLGVLANPALAWARVVVQHLAREVSELHLIELNAGKSSPPAGAVASAEVTALRDSVTSWRRIPTALPASLTYFLRARSLRRILEECGCQVLITLYGGGYATMAAFSGFRPYVVYLMGSDIHYAGPALRILNRFSLRGAERVLSNGEALGSMATDQVSGITCVSCYHGIDVEKFPFSREVRENIIICTRGFASIYNNEQLIRALAIVPQVLAKWKVVFTASGPELLSARRLTQKLLPDHMQNRIVFLGGVPHEEMARLLSRARVYVSLSDYDGSSTSLLEALAVGLYPIVSDTAANREWLDPSGASGILVPLGDVESLAASLTKISSYPLDDGEILERNRRHVAERGNIALSRKVIVGHLLDAVSSQKSSKMRETGR